MLVETGILSAKTSESFRSLVKKLTGISLPAGKTSMIEQRLRRRVIACGLPGTEDYLRALLNGDLDEGELRIVIDLITTNTTSFFREAEHFVFLTNTILPEIINRSTREKPRVKIWSAASSEGAEAYTCAMVLAEMRRQGTSFDWAVLGTDISERMIVKATRGIYDVEQFSTVPADLKRRYVMGARDQQFQNKMRISPALRKRVRFGLMNLMDETYPVARDVDVVFLRNILIYFSPEDKLAVVQRVAKHLRAGGYLIVGHAESMVVKSPSLQQVMPTIFRKD